MRAANLLPAALAAGALLSWCTGCGAMSALANPKAAWALSEPAPMALILRRADAARATATNVDRLLSGTPVDAASKWIPKVGLSRADAEAALNEIGGDPDYAVPPAKGAKLRVVAAEAWARALTALCPHEGRFPSLIAQISPDLGTAYSDIDGQARAVAKLKADKEAEDKAMDQPDVSQSDKDAHEKKKSEIQDQIDKLEQDYRPKVDDFLSKLRDAGAKASPEAKKQIPVAFVALKHAIDDAKLANSVAILRYPMALPGMPQELKTQAKRIVADVVEDKTGHRPVLDQFQPDIKLEGGSPKLTLNGLPPDALGSLSPDALLHDVTARSKDYVVRVLTLTAYVAETEELLDLETEVIKNAMDGLSAEEGKVEGAGDDLSDVKVELDGIGAATKAAKSGKTRHPVPMTGACGDVKVPKYDVAKALKSGDKGDKGDKPSKPASSPGSTQPSAPKKKPDGPLID